MPLFITPGGAKTSGTPAEVNIVTEADTKSATEPAPEAVAAIRDAKAHLASIAISGRRIVAMIEAMESSEVSPESGGFSAHDVTWNMEPPITTAPLDSIPSARSQFSTALHDLGLVRAIEEHTITDRNPYVTGHKFYDIAMPVADDFAERRILAFSRSADWELLAVHSPHGDESDILACTLTDFVQITIANFTSTQIRVHEAEISVPSDPQQNTSTVINFARLQCINNSEFCGEGPKVEENWLNILAYMCVLPYPPPKEKGLA
ncbi:hypothetical protein PSPO01_14624 [Paraphaeosphaeria sporulosa]